MHKVKVKEKVKSSQKHSNLEIAFGNPFLHYRNICKLFAKDTVVNITVVWVFKHMLYLFNYLLHVEKPCEYEHF